MTRPHQLEDSLRSIRLLGMLETLETRLAQASAGELGHLELLQVLCGDEIARRDAAGMERRLAAAAWRPTGHGRLRLFAGATRGPLRRRRGPAPRPCRDSRGPARPVRRARAGDG